MLSFTKPCQAEIHLGATEETDEGTATADKCFTRVYRKILNLKSCYSNICVSLDDISSCAAFEISSFLTNV